MRSYKTLLQRYLKIRLRSYRFTRELTQEQMAELLHIAVGSPLLYIRRISFDKDNHPRECVCTYYRADTYHLEIELAI